MDRMTDTRKNISGVFQVEMDDFYFAEYDHKLPINKFTHAVIDGEISLYGVKVNRVSTLTCNAYGEILM